MIPTKFQFIWSSGFREEDFFKSANQKQELSVAAMFVNGSGRNEQYLQRTFHRCFLPRFGLFGQVVSEEKTQKSTNQKQELAVVAMFVSVSELNEQSLQRTFQGCFLPSFDLIWPCCFRGEDFFRNQPIRNNNRLWRPCLLTDRDEMSNLYR